ncbi:MAG: DUF4349 domain-containing protein [Myxococcales bacterium]|nr:DUF4349 domain-containing protein [Myxococcales bacterium]
MRLFIASLLLLPFAAAAQAPAPPAATAAEPAAPETGARQTALTAHLVVKVVHPDEVRRALIDGLKPHGAFPTLVSDTQLVLKIPPEQLSMAINQVADSGVVISKTLERQDLTQAIAQLEAQLRSKRQIFDKLRALIDDSNVEATLQIEQNMANMVAEMEQLAGRLRVERERARYAVIDVAFQFRERQRVVYVRSPFKWLDSVDLERFDARF